MPLSYTPKYAQSSAATAQHLGKNYTCESWILLRNMVCFEPQGFLVALIQRRHSPDKLSQHMLHIMCTEQHFQQNCSREDWHIAL